MIKTNTRTTKSLFENYFRTLRYNPFGITQGERKYIKSVHGECFVNVMSKMYRIHELKSFNFRISPKISQTIGIFLAWTIQALRPLLGADARCKFTITCTPFAIQQLKEMPFHKACWTITQRVLTCNPLSSFLLYIRTNK